MLSPLRSAAILLSATACTFLLVTTPASAAESTLVLSKQGAEIDSLLPLPKLVTLNCEPASGTHPSRDEACAVLARAGGDFTRLKPLDRLCTLNYSPTRVRADGRWHGRQVEWEAVFPNECAAESQTEMVFAY
jgi:hypothetical protein